MATVIVRLCDRHQDKGENVDAESRTVALDPFSSYELDLCPPCWDDLTNGLAEAIAKWGSRAQGTPAPKTQRRRYTVAPGEDPNGLAHLTRAAQAGVRRGKEPSGARAFKCLWCSLDYATQGGVMGHAQEIHQLPSHSLEEFGLECPVCAHVIDGRPKGAFTTHARVFHAPLTNVIQLFHLAADQGDPHGIVKSILAKADWTDGGIVIAKGA